MTYTINQLHSSHWTPSSLKDRDKDLIHIPKLFLQEADPQQIKSADRMQVKTRPVETRLLMMLASSPWCQSIQELSTSWSCIILCTADDIASTLSHQATLFMMSHPLHASHHTPVSDIAPLYLCHHNLSTDITPTFEWHHTHLLCDILCPK